MPYNEAKDLVKALRDAAWNEGAVIEKLEAGKATATDVSLAVEATREAEEALLEAMCEE